MKRLAMAVLALSLATGGAALAQGDDPLAHYDAYFAAIDAGDYARASQEGEAAWRAAESAWGEDGDTGLLAFTLAQFRINTGDIAGAAEPARRALELANLSSEYTENEARLLAGITMANSDPDAARQQLQAAVSGLDAAGVQPRDDIIAGELTLAMLQIGADSDAAAATAKAAVEDSRSINSVNLRNHLAELGKVQYLTGDFPGAAASLGESLMMWERQAPGVMPAALGNTYAWHEMTLLALQRSAPDGAAPPPGGGRGFGPFRWGFLPDISACNIDYEEQEPAVFPAAEGETATLGAAIVMYDLDENGETTNIHFVGAAPDVPHHEQFILDRIGSLKTRRFVREPCRVGHVQAFRYDY